MPEGGGVGYGQSGAQQGGIPFQISGPNVAPSSGGNPVHAGTILINASPSVLSLGEVMKTLAGPQSNGGSGILPTSFYFQNPQGTVSVGGAGSNPSTLAGGLPKIALYAALGFAAFLVLRKLH